jgi:dienelactone hydrolase
MSTKRRGRAKWILLGTPAVIALAVAMLYRPVDRHARAAALLLRIESRDPPEGFAAYGAHAIEERDASWARGRSREYVPAGVEDPPGVLLVHGVHPDGIDEPRLRAFARAIASAGVRVATPELADLTEFRIDASTIDDIGVAAIELAREVGHDEVGVIGISFAGGLSLAAVARENGAADRVAFVLSIGGHHDLRRVVRWYIGERADGPDGLPETTEPHPYGAGVFIYAHLDDLFGPEDVEAARQVLGLALNERPREARALAQRITLSEAGRARLAQVLDRNDDESLARDLLGVIEAHAAELEAASPARSLHAVTGPVFLVHGADDPIVPAIETRWLARDLPEDALEAVLVTDALRHAEYDEEPSYADRFQMVTFMAAVLAAIEDT